MEPATQAMLSAPGCARFGLGGATTRTCTEGDGCGADLAWWFSAEATEEATKKAKAPPARALTLDDLPPACRTVLLNE